MTKDEVAAFLARYDDTLRGTRVQRGKETGEIIHAVHVKKMGLRYLVRFPPKKNHDSGYEQYCNADTVRVIDDERNRTMIIHTFGGQANIMGKDTGFIYDGKLSELRIQGITFEDAQKVLASLENGSGVATAVKEILNIATAPAAPAIGAGGGGGTLPSLAADALNKAHAAGELDLAGHAAKTGSGKAPLTVDPAKMQQIAQASPQPPPKPEKAPKKTVDKKPETKPEEEAKTTAAEETPPPAESTKQVTANGKAHTNGAAKPAVDVSAELMEARKLRDVLAHLMDKENLTDPEQLKKRCNDLKDTVPCLTRIQDLDSRIDRTLEVMDMSEDIS